jgi:hypothetical protein
MQAQHALWVKADVELKELEQLVRFARNTKDRAKEEVEATENIMQALILDRQKRRK